METQGKGQITIPKELERRRGELFDSFTEALEFIEENKKTFPALALWGTPQLNRREKKSLKLLPKAFALNTTTNQLEFNWLQVKHILVSEAFRAVFRNETLKIIVFKSCTEASDERLLKLMCQGLEERSSAFQLELMHCSSEFLKTIIEASYLNCFSLTISSMDCVRVEVPLKNLFKRNLCYITLYDVKGFKESLFFGLGRCISELPTLAKLFLSRTIVSISALKRLYGSMKKILGSERSNLFESLYLGLTEVGEKLSYAFFRLLSSDLIGSFNLNVKRELSTAVVKSISSTVANTKNLKSLIIGKEFTSGTKFKNFKLQETGRVFCAPFEVNPIII